VKTAKKQFETIDEYIATFPEPFQKTLQKLRQTIKDSAPEAKRDGQLSNACFQIEWYLGVFCSLQKPYWILSDSLMNK